MKKPVNTNVRLKDYSPGQAMLLPPSLEDMIDANHPVRIVNKVIDQVEIDPLIVLWNLQLPSPDVTQSSGVLLPEQHLLFKKDGGCLEREHSFHVDPGMNTPDHNTINRFRSERLKGVVKHVFSKVVELLAEQGTVNFN